MDVNTTTPSAMIIAFVPRRKRPVVGIAIRGDFSLGPVTEFMAVPANNYHTIRVEDGGAP